MSPQQMPDPILTDAMTREASESLRQSEERLSLAVDAARLGIWDWDIRTGEIVWNAHHETIFGYAPGQSKRSYRDFADRIRPEDLERVEAGFRQAMQERTEYRFEHRVVWPDGTIRWVEAYGRFHYDATGQASRSVGTLVDITERKRAESELARLTQASEQQRRIYETVLSNTADFNYVFDLRGRFIYVNKALLALWGKQLHEAIGKDFHELGYPPELAERLQRQIQTAIDTRQPLTDETPYTSAVGERQYEYIFVPVLGADGTVEAVAGSTRDITERKRVEEALRQRVEEIRTLLDTLPIAILITHDPDCREITGNPAAHELLRTQNQNLSKTAPPGEQPTHFRVCRNGIEIPPSQLPVQRAARGEQIRGEEIDDVFDDGTVTHTLMSAAPLYDEQGRVRGAIASMLDVTEQKRAEAQIRASEERFRTLFNTMDQAFCVVDLLYDADNRPVDYRFLEANPTFERHTGFKDAMGRTIRELVPEHDAHWFETYGAVLATGEPIRFVNEAKAMGRWYDVYAYRLGGPDSRKLGILFTDITAQKQIENYLRQMAAALAETDRRKNEFLATLAHELRNPLAPIRNGLQIMRFAGGDSATIEQVRDMMDRQLTQLVRLVDDLMDMSRISQGKLELRRERLQLADVLKSAIETSRPLIEEMGHELNFVFPNEPIVVDADLTRLAQVFMNLLNNAAKYSNWHGRIWLTVERQESEVVVSVRDQGIGIAADQLPRLFEMFAQLEHSLERSQGGLGIGLTLVKRLVEMHGGRIAARSDGPGKGSEFIVRLPLVAEASVSPERQHTNDAHMTSSLRILIVDDNRDAADSLAMMLKTMGNQTCTAYDGERAVSARQEFRPDVIVLDIGLPKMNGYDACRRIREQADGKKLVMIAQTGWGQAADRQRTHSAGFDYHLVKPVDPVALMKLLADLSAAMET